MSVWFSSDLHLGHLKVAEERGFDTAAEHDTSIYSTLTRTLKRADQLWVLGDMTVGGTGAETEALFQLGTIAQVLGAELHLIAGNHDSIHPMRNRNSHTRQRVFLETFTSVQLFARRKIAGQQVLLSHFPYIGDHTDEDRGVQYRLRDEGEWLLHGHTHSTEVTAAAPCTREVRVGGELIESRPCRQQIHVGFDAWNRPVHLDEITDIITTGKESVA